MSLSSIRKKEKVTDLVLTQLKDSLKRGELKPGDKLPGTSELAAKMEVGISSVREAIKMLESLGAVESRHGEGTFVCNTLREGAANAFEIQMMLLPRTAEYLVQFREFFETAYTHLALEQATTADLEQIEIFVVALEKKVQRLSPNALMEPQDELDFHRSVLYCTHNPYIIKIGEVALELFFDAVQDLLVPLKINDAVEDHRNILEALRNRDTALLNRVFQKNLPAWYARFKNVN
jgi:GntR family transcriptional repressor for pyruvate dehydrogenase complex